MKPRRNLGIESDKKFDSEINPHCRETIRANFVGGIEYEDLQKRDLRSAPEVDLYIGGFPCQSFSRAGLKEAFNDKKGRGRVFFAIAEYIHAKTPKVFMLEHVQGLLSKDKGKVFEVVLNCLRRDRKYRIEWCILKTKEHGIPQNRPRLWIVGIRSDIDPDPAGLQSLWSEPIPCRSIEDFLDERCPTLASMGTHLQSLIAQLWATICMAHGF